MENDNFGQGDSKCPFVPAAGVAVELFGTSKLGKVTLRTPVWPEPGAKPVKGAGLDGQGSVLQPLQPKLGAYTKKGTGPEKPAAANEGVDKAEAALKEESRIEREALRKANSDLRLENEVLCKVIGRQQAEVEKLKAAK